MSRLTGIRDCRAVTESTVGNCIKGDFENHSCKSPLSFRHSSKDALADPCLIKHDAGPVEKELTARSKPPRVVPRSALNVNPRRILSPVEGYRRPFPRRKMEEEEIEYRSESAYAFP